MRPMFYGGEKYLKIKVSREILGLNYNRDVKEVVQ